MPSKAFKDPVRRFSQELWDLRLKLSPASRTLGECDRYDPNNTEFTISLLDCRYLAGDRDLFRRLHDKVIPKLVMRESKALLQGLAEVTRERHAKYGMTLYHLEPNLKEAPGGLRDCNVATWLALISAMDKLHDWPDASSLRRSGAQATGCGAGFSDVGALLSALPPRARRQHAELGGAGRSGGAQDRSQCRSAADADSELSAADWMRIYFGHARAVQRTVTQLLEEIPEAWSALYRQVQSWRSRLTTADFSVVDGLIFLQQPSALQDPEVLAPAVPFHGAPRAEVERDHRIPHRAGASGAGVDCRRAEPSCGSICRRRCCSRMPPTPCAPCIRLRLLTLLLAGTEADRFAGGARFLSSLHRR